MRVLVTGGAGFVGSYLVDQLVAEGHEVHVIDALVPQVHPTALPPEWINPGAQYHFQRIRFAGQVIRSLRPEIVYHLAAQVGVGQAQYQIRNYTDDNCGDTAALLEWLMAAKGSRPQKVVVASSMSCYGEGLYECGQVSCRNIALRSPVCHRHECEAYFLPIPEEAKLLSPSVYAATKEYQEKITLSVCQAYGVPAVALRYFNIYGPRQQPSNPYTGVCAIFLARLLNGKAPLVYEDGFQTRDFISVHDVTKANMLAGLTDAEGTFNVCTGVGTSIRIVADLLSEQLGLDISPEITGKRRAGDIRHCIGDPHRAKAGLGFEAEINLDDGLAELCEWAKTQQVTDKVESAHAELRERGLA